MSAKHPLDNNRLRQVRLRKGWKQEQVAEKLGVAFETVSRWERGEAFPSPLLREELSRLFGLSLDALGLTQRVEASAPQTSAVALVSASAEADRALVMQCHADLHAHGLVAWSLPSIKQLDATQKRTVLREAIRSTELVIVVVSPATRSSRDVRTTLEQATLYRRPVCAIWTAGEQWQACFPEGRGQLIATIDARTAPQEMTIKELIRVYQQVQQAARKHTDAPAAVSSSSHVQGEPRNPYKGLRAFDSEDQRDFFGRDQVVAELTTRLENMIHPERHQQQVCFLTVLGPSGSGKSSVIAAGLLPHLKRGAIQRSEKWIYLPQMVPGSHPLESLAQVLAEHFPDRSITTLRADLEDESTRGLHRLVSTLGDRPDKKVVLTVDQGEELFTLTTNEAERQLFIDLLITATTEPHSSLIVLLTLRADFVERALLVPEFATLMQQHTYFLRPMELHELRAAIEEPARLPEVQLAFEESLVGDLLFEAQGQPGALPLLEFTLEQLFQQRGGRTFTLSAYQKMGGVKGALTKQAESTYAALPSEEHRRLARALFLRLIDVGMSEQDMARRRAALTELLLPEQKQTIIMQEVVEAFIAARLLTTNEFGGVPTVEVCHEALIREWPRLTNWLREAREDIRLQRTISEDVAEWERHGKPGDRLYRGSQLKEARAWARRNIPSGNELAFIHASFVSKMRFLVSVIVVVLMVASSLGEASWVLTHQPDPTRVTNLKDTGVGSLRWAIDNVPPGGTISFDANLHGTILLSNDDLHIAKNLKILGSGAGKLSISSGKNGRIVLVMKSFSVTISDLTFKDSYTPWGIIDNEGTLVLANSIISSNTTLVNDGAIRNAGILTLSNSTITNNGGFGDSIFNSGTLTLNRSTIFRNKCISGGCGIRNEDGSIVMNNSTVSGNTATAPGSGGGGIFNSGTISMNNSNISGNTAAFPTTSGLGGEGGGIFNSNGTLTLNNSTVSGNTATGPGGFGGGIFNSSGTLTLNNSTVSDNRANGGGGIFNQAGGVLMLTNSTISGNTVTGPEGIGPEGFGGGILISESIGGVSFPQVPQADITFSTIYGNTAPNGGDIAVGYVSYSTSNGNIINVKQRSQVRIRNSILVDGPAHSGSDVVGTLTSYGYNLFQNNSGATFDPATRIQHGTDKILSANNLGRLFALPVRLQANGGVTKTLALASGSPTVDQIPLDACYVTVPIDPTKDSLGTPIAQRAITTDQRGAKRPDGDEDKCDIGAYEYMDASP